MNTEEPFYIDLGRHYKIAFCKMASGDVALEIYTTMESISRMQYATVMMKVLHYMGTEGFFDGWLPQKLNIYNRHGQMVLIENIGD